MNNLIVRQPGESVLVSPTSFADLENDIRQLDQVFEETIDASPTTELLASVDAAVAVIERSRTGLRAAAAPASKREAGAHLMILTRAYPNVGLKDGKYFGRLMLEDVLSLEPCVGAVDIACRCWRRHNKFLPAISEILAQIKVEDARIKRVTDFARELPDLRERMARKLGIQPGH